MKRITALMVMLLMAFQTIRADFPDDFIIPDFKFKGWVAEATFAVRDGLRSYPAYVRIGSSRTVPGTQPEHWIYVNLQFIDGEFSSASYLEASIGEASSHRF